MTGETTNNDQPLTGRKRTKKKSLIGIDPLAWMKDEAVEDNQASIMTDEVPVSGQETVQFDEVEIVEEVNDEMVTEDSIDEVSIEVSENLSSDETVMETEAITETEIVDQEIKEEEVLDMEINKDDSGVKLDGPISIADVAELHAQFKTYLAEGNDLEIDCSEVEGVDAAALQLLTAFINEAEKQDNKLIWKEPSDSLQATVLMMGLKDEFKM